MARDLQLRLILTHLSVLLCGLLFLGVTFTIILSNRVTAAHQGDLRYETASLAAQLDHALAKNVRQTTLQGLIRRDSELMGKRIILLDRRGRVRYDSSRWTPFSRGSWSLVDLAALRHDRWAPMGSSDRFGWQVPLTLGGHVAGAVALVVTASDNGTPWQQILPAFLAVLGLLLLVWLVIGAHLVHSLTRPLRQVADALVLVRGGQYDRPVPEEGWSQARELARRYNEMVAEVARSHQLLRDFIANAAHELKTPVALVAGFADALADGTAQRENALREAVSFIQAESQHLTHIVNQLFALASLDADPEALVLTPCQPSELLRQVVARFASQAREEGKTLSCACRDALPVCIWDTQRVTSALANLIANALDATEGGDAIVVQAAGDGNEVVLAVEDTGRGIAGDDLPHIFDRFYRGQASTRSQGHAGLGLALVREVAQRHGGTVTVQSQLGHGTCFTVSLPRDPSGTACASHEQSFPASGLPA